MNKIFCFWKTNPSDENFDENEPFNTTNYEPFEESKGILFSFFFFSFFFILQKSKNKNKTINS